MPDLATNPDQLTALLQRGALLRLPGQQPAPAPAQQPGIAGQQMRPAMVAPPLGAEQTQKDQQQLSDLRNNGSGVDNIQNGFLRGMARVGDVLGSTLAPRAMQFIPGTTLHHERQLTQATQAMNQDLGSAKEQAQTAELQAMPQLKETQAELAREKQQNLEQNQQSRLSLDQDKLHSNELQQKTKTDASLREHGFKQDEAGAIVPLKYEEMSPQQQSIADLQASRQELVDAQAAFKKAQQSNLPVQMQLAAARIANAQHNGSIAEQRLGLSKEMFAAHMHGTDLQGQALPGAMIGEDGRPVGSVFQQNVRPTGQERNKADMALSAHDQIQDMLHIVHSRADIFGPAGGRKTDFTVWLGSQDPDAQRFRAARTIAGDHLAGTFGGRSEAALSAIDNAIGHFKDNPAAIDAGLKQLDQANNVFLQRGKVHTASSNSAPQAQQQGSKKEKDPLGIR